MSAFLIAVLIVAGVGAFMWLAVKSADSDHPKPYVAGIVVLAVAALTAIILAAQSEEDSGPCLRYETRYMLSGKVLVPYRACVERGEWVKDGAS